MVVADSCAIYANQIFNNATDFGGSTLLLGAVFFTFQIYGDFSGYSDIALGTARLFGFELLQNFKFPYFSRDIAEFWRRWHISLSSWFKDYVYIPLGGSKGSKTKQIRNVLIIFLLSGLWHGASWNFVIWGLINAIYFIPLLVFNRNRSHLEIAASNTFLPSLKELFQITVTFCLTVLAWIFFRSASVGQAIGIIQTIFSESLFTIPSIKPKYTILMLLVFIAMEWLGRKNNYAIASFFASSPAWMRWMFYYLLVFSILYCSGSDQQFIYFQF
jgi:D-alanyl-lipoteichoic acid acyltransferase DltB (MBOAT superfamily)